MARIYDVVCLKCGEVHHWCKYDPPFERCEKCGAKLTTTDKKFIIEEGAYEFDAYPGWDRRKVKVFGV